jgi:hypothetical protein
MLPRRSAVRQPGYLLARRPLGFAPPPHDGFALLASAHKDATACRHTFPGWVAGPDLVGSEVAVLRPHVGSSSHVTAAAYSCERGERITQMQYFLHFSLRTSENSVYAKFAEFLF